VLRNYTPNLFQKHAEMVIKYVNRNPNIKSWNEWTEGNYIEPDLKYGHEYLNILDLFKNRLNHPIIVYDTTNQCHSQRMPVVVMSPIRI
jgi:hypothetical protein